MDDSQFRDAPGPAHSTAYPMANPGYGKRATTTRSTAPPTAEDYAHLPPREAAIAAFIDRLPDGTDMSVKGLARITPYGQCALRTALNALQRAGHLRRGREHLLLPTGARWITRTWFSRAARDDAWWAAFVSGSLPEDGTVTPDPVPDDTPPPTPPAPSPASTRATRSPAYRVLAGLGRRNPAVSLSARDCDALEDLAARWFERGATEEMLVRALTDGLPSDIHHAAGLIRRRLTDKLPPEPEPEPPGPGSEPAHPDRRPLRMLECSECRAPGRPEALTDGKCGPCRGEEPPARRPGALAPERVSAHAAQARAGARAASVVDREPADVPGVRQAAELVDG
ncbi:hypothetical protein [Streptomyces montanisoli]|uniref:Uncharacterized protein n=1 Tax=Streptomyces montanisoli TaxID=2798581 RepID=A0A940RUT9_9ACTN|nr:hypothetical protein [Streptomyces montanisoli]MBP0457570.1 hypothetical protein [Streptomyces montanisoli]